MAKKSPRLNDFRSGEMTPGLGARSDLAAYSKGCILMKNCMPLVEGGIMRVPGTRFLRTVKQTEEGNYLIGWYKFNEGSGLIVNNYAMGGSLGGGLLPNLDVLGDTDIFWNTELGVGYSQAPIPYDGPSICWAAKEFASRPTNLISYGFFYKRTANIELGGILGVFIAVEGVEETSFTVDNDIFLGYQDDFDGTAMLDNIPNVWGFFFIDDSWIPKRVNPDGTLSLFDSNIIHEEFNINRLSIGSDYDLDYYYGSGGAFGDVIIYNNYCPSLTEWAEWYDLLRFRYGMAARSGW